MTGRLIYVMGASGSGKDTLIKVAASELKSYSNIRFARRFITRSEDPEGENHLPITQEEFNTRLKNRLFALHWSGNGHDYGIGVEVNQWLNRGQTVVVNGTRQWFAEARVHYPNLEPVLIEVSLPILRQRLSHRGRESEAQVEARLLRHKKMQPQPSECIIINNDGPLVEASQVFINTICKTAREPRLCK